MDLHSMLNDDSREPQPASSRSSIASPTTPAQSIPHRASFHQSHPSPSRRISQEYPPHHFSTSPPQYSQQHTPLATAAVPFQMRAAPPPLQPPAPATASDPRSPGSAVSTPFPHFASPITTASAHHRDSIPHTHALSQQSPQPISQQTPPPPPPLIIERPLPTMQQKRKISEVDGGEDKSRDSVRLRMSNGPPSQTAETTTPRPYPEPPAWARAHDDHISLTNGNWSFKKRGPTTPAPRAPFDSCMGGSVPPLADIHKEIADFLFLNVVSHPNAGEIRVHGIKFEIEAKLGVLVDKNMGARISLPITSEVVLDRSNNGIAFESNISEVQHRYLNACLNKLVVDSRSNSSHRDTDALPTEYSHRHEVDTFFELSREQRDTLPAIMQILLSRRFAPKVRVSRDKKDGTIIGTILKAKVADLHLHFPKSPVDCRITVNLEMPWSGSLQELQERSAGSGDVRDRKKNRMSYKNGIFQVDLTQVMSSGGSGPMTAKQHELEIEVDPDYIRSAGEQALERDSSKYTDVIEAFLNRIRYITSEIAVAELELHKRASTDIR